MDSSRTSPKMHRIAIAVFFFVAGLCFASWASRIPTIKDKLHLNESGLGLILFSLPIGTMISLPFTGWIISRFGSRPVLLLASVLYPTSLLFIGSVNNQVQLAVILVCFGMFGNFYNISVNTQAVAVEKLYGRTIMASFHGIWSLAGFTGAAIGSFFLALKIPTMTHFSIVFGLAIGLVLLFGSYTVQMKQPSEKKGQPIFAKPDRTILLFGLIAFGSMICEGTMFDWSGVYFQKVVKAPEKWVSVGYMLFMGFMAGGRFISDRLTLRFGTRNILQASGILICSGLGLAVLFPNFLTAGLGFMMVGLGVSSIVPLVYSSAGRSKTMSPGAALAAVSTIGFIGFLLGPPMIGFVAQAAGLQWSFGIIAVMGLSISFLSGYKEY